MTDKTISGTFSKSVANKGTLRSPAKIRLAAAVKNQPYRNITNDSRQGKNDSDRASQESQREPVNMSSIERLEPYLKTSTPIKPLKNYVSTVSYLRPATESKNIMIQNNTDGS